MRRLEDTGTYTDDEINSLARRGKQRGHILGVGRVLPVRVTAVPSRPAPESTLKSLHKKVDFMMRLFKSDSLSTLMRFHSLSRLVPTGVAGAAGVGMTRRVPTIRRTRIRMVMAIVSCVIYWLVCYIVTLCSSWRLTYSDFGATGSMIGATIGSEFKIRDLVWTTEGWTSLVLPLSSFGLVIVLPGRVPEPKDKAVEECGVDEPELGKPELDKLVLDKLVLDKLEVGFDFVLILIVTVLILVETWWS
nr:F-box domain, leucine-rich repeat domain, L domain-like protein [Tanacetum cinerariifolium]